MLSYAEYESRLWASAQRHHLPIAGSFELTYRCNFDCVHCFQQDVRDQNEASTEVWLRLVDQLADAGCLWLTLTGGEAIIHPGFAAIYERAVRRGMLVTVFSNGSTLSEKIIDLFARLPPRTIEVTMYGASAETYEKSTGRARHYDLAIAGVKRAIAAGFDVHLKTMVFKETADDFAAMQALAKELGRPFRYDTSIHATIGGSHAPTHHRLEPEAIIALEQRDQQVTDEILVRHADPKNHGSDQVYRCGAGRFAFNVAPDGYLQLCTLVRTLRFDLAQTPFSEAWSALGDEVQRRYASSNRRCNGCDIRHMCGTCPGVAELETGDPEGAVDHICETTHLRASAVLGRTIRPKWKGEPTRQERLKVIS